MSSFPAESDARRDHALRGTPIVVYDYLLTVLDARDWREVKRLVLCAELGLGRTTVRAAVALLVRRGYVELDQDTRAGTGKPRRYRLCYSRNASAA